MQRSAAWIAVGIVATGSIACRRAPKPADTQSTPPPAAAAEASNEPFTAPNREFSMAFPQKPFHQVTSRGPVYQTRTDEYAYTVNKLDCPREFEDDDRPTRLFDALQKASVDAVNGELQWQEDVSSGGQGVFGREFVVHAVTPGTGKPYEMAIRLFRLKDRVWLVQAIGPQTDESRADRTAVLDSFALL